MAPAAGALLGAAFFLWIAGLRIVDPREIGWVMQADWRIHFLGWHFFRSEPWAWPPGRISGYFHAPDGTALGFTDSIPLAAFLLKPAAHWLPMPFQYLGCWLLLCFALQGAFGVLLARLWTPGVWRQLLAAMLFVLSPTLLNRVQHPALCAHWLLLCALWLYFTTSHRAVRGTAHGTLGAAAGLVHPYLAMMVIAIVSATSVRVRSPLPLALTAACVLAGWWAAGLFTVGDVQHLASEGLGAFSMNLLGPITPVTWSSILPELPVGASGQPFEGFQYLGLGILALLATALALRRRVRHDDGRAALWPVAVAAGVCALYALSPRITFGSVVLADFTHPALDRLAIFRATGRFFWPAAYAMTTVALAAVLPRVPRLAGAAVLAGAVALQIVDLQAKHARLRADARSEVFYAHRLPLNSPLWDAALPHYRHLVMYLPPQCGTPPAPWEWPAYLAGKHGLTINAGEVARADTNASKAYCDRLEDAVQTGRISDDTLYLVTPGRLEQFQRSSPAPVLCVTADRLPVCVTAASSAAWRSAVMR